MQLVALLPLQWKNNRLQVIHSLGRKEGRRRESTLGVSVVVMFPRLDRSRPSDNFFSLRENKSHAWPLLPPGIAMHPTTTGALLAIVSAAQQDVVTLRYRLKGSVCSRRPQAEPVEVNPAMHARVFCLYISSFKTVQASLQLHFSFWQNVYFISHLSCK